MKLFISWMCKLGIHEWSKWIYLNIRGRSTYAKSRYCQECKAVQIQKRELYEVRKELELKKTPKKIKLWKKQIIIL